MAVTKQGNDFSHVKYKNYKTSRLWRYQNQNMHQKQPGRNSQFPGIPSHIRSVLSAHELLHMVRKCANLGRLGMEDDELSKRNW